MKNSTKSSDLSEEIKRLEREAEQYNNPQYYVKYAKMERQINTLKKKLEFENGITHQEDNGLHNFMNFMPDNIYLKLGVEITFYLINIIIAIYYRSENIKFKADNYSDNVVINYFKDDQMIKIPFYLIIIGLQMSISRVENLFNLTYNLVK